MDWLPQKFNEGYVISPLESLILSMGQGLFKKSPLKALWGLHIIEFRPLEGF